MDQHDPWTRIAPAGDVNRVVGQVELPERNALPCVLTLRPRYPRSKIHVLWCPRGAPRHKNNPLVSLANLGLGL